MMMHHFSKMQSLHRVMFMQPLAFFSTNMGG